ncbi:Uncharacterised protein [Arcanobacterium haemolyticum]|nr:Uncharacterised protein [Arcanobacterium haemolyticum]
MPELADSARAVKDEEQKEWHQNDDPWGEGRRRVGNLRTGDPANLSSSSDWNSHSSESNVNGITDHGHERGLDWIDSQRNDHCGNDGHWRTEAGKAFEEATE